MSNRYLEKIAGPLSGFGAAVERGATTIRTALGEIGHSGVAGRGANFTGSRMIRLNDAGITLRNRATEVGKFMNSSPIDPASSAGRTIAQAQATHFERANSYFARASALGKEHGLNLDAKHNARKGMVLGAAKIGGGLAVGGLAMKGLTGGNSQSQYQNQAQYY